MLIDNGKNLRPSHKIKRYLIKNNISNNIIACQSSCKQNKNLSPQTRNQNKNKTSPKIVSELSQ